jgi:hypothetical protein
VRRLVVPCSRPPVVVAPGLAGVHREPEGAPRRAGRESARVSVPISRVLAAQRDVDRGRSSSQIPSKYSQPSVTGALLPLGLFSGPPR